MSSIRPVHFGVSLSENCNLACRMCLRRKYASVHATRFMSLDTFRRLLAKLPDSIQSVNISAGLGEPLLNPEILGIIRLSKSKNLRTICFSNGTLFSEGMAKALTASGLDLLLISIDSFSADRYAAIRVGSSINPVLDGIRHVSKQKTEGWSGELRVSKVLFRDDSYESVSRFVEKANELPIDGIEFRLEAAFNERFPIDSYHKLGLEKMAADSSVPIYGPRVGSCGDYICYDVASAVYFDTEGRLRACCMDFGTGEHFDDFTKAFSNGKNSQIRKWLRNGIIPSGCRNCLMLQPETA